MPNTSGNEPRGDPAVQAHPTILQQLNRKIGDDFFPVESFENVADWESVPVIFAQEHPDMEAYDLDPAAELARIAETTGRRADVVGTPTNARIERTGRPRLQADLNWNADPDVQRLFNEGKLGVSTGFWAHTKDNQLDGYVKPHHILLFEEDQSNQPRDKGAVVLNKETNMKSFTNEGRVLSGKNPTRLNEIFEMLKTFIEEITGGSAPVTNQDPVDPAASMEMQIDDVRKALSTQLGLFWPDGSPRDVWVRMTFPDSVIWEHPTTNKTLKSPYTVDNGRISFGDPVEVVQTYTEIEEKTNMVDTEIASKDAEIAELKNKISEMESKNTEYANKIAEIETAQKEAAWQTLKNKLPPGMVHTPELEKETRDLFESDPVSFTNKLIDLRVEATKPEAGQAFTNQDEDPVAKRNEIFSRRVAIPGTLH